LREQRDRTPVRCWEQLSCGHMDCEARNPGSVACWLVGESRCFDHPTCLTERLELKCADCPVFQAHKGRAAGKRASDGAVITTMENLLAECAQLLTGTQALKSDLKTKSSEVTLLSEVGNALQSTMELDELLMVILTAVTAGNGLGFNRAFLIMSEEKSGRLKGRMAVGPSHPDEAASIWNAMKEEGKSLGQILAATSAEGRAAKKAIMDVALAIDLPYDPQSNIVAQSLEDGKSFIVNGAADRLETRVVAEAISSDYFIVAPLLAKGRKLGAVVADNFVTGRNISREDVRLLEMLATQAALAILNASLHGRLQERIEQLQAAHRQLLEDQLQLLRAERLVAAGGLASTFVHEVKTPLVSIGLMARAAAAEVADGDKVREALDSISMEILKVEESLKHIVKSASTATRDTRIVDVPALIRETLGLLGGVMRDSGIDAVLEFNHRDAAVAGNTLELRQMLLNIFHNSVEAMPGGGRLTVRTGVDGRMLRLTAEDTGCGMPEDVMVRVFSPFFTTKQDGSGLGLVIARRIANEHGGRLSFESKEGAGTRFHILLPIAEGGREEEDSKNQ
jgi:signal transduction histidine kinase